MAFRLSALISGILVGLWLGGCAPVGPAPVTGATTGPAVPAGHARVFMMREHSILQAPVRAEIALNGVRVATLRHEDYTYLDVPAGKYLLSVEGLPNDGAWRAGLELGEKQASYILIAPNKRPQERSSLFQDSRRFDLQGGPFVVRPVDAEIGEGLLRTMRYRTPEAATVKPAQG